MVLVEKGIYRARALAENRTTGEAENGNPLLSIPMRIVEECPSRGAIVPWQGNFANDQAVEITTKALRAMGWDGVDIEALAGVGTVDCDITVEHESYVARDGQPRVSAKVKFVSRIGRDFKNPLTDAGRKRMRDAVARLGSKGKAKPLNEAPPKDGAPAEGDDGWTSGDWNDEPNF